MTKRQTTSSCRQCGTPLVGSAGPGRPRRFCGDECRRLFWAMRGEDQRRHRIKCEGCGIEFESARRNQKYHDQACARAARSRRKREELEAALVTSVWSCGAGVQSVAIAALITSGRIEAPDIALMCDTGQEKAITYQYLHEVLIPNLRQAGVELELLDTSEHVELVNPQGHVTIPAFVEADGEVTRLPTHCSANWKLNQAKRWLRARGVKRCENWVGISLDEARRVKESRVRWITHRYPLIEQGLTRFGCIEFILGQGWPEPSRSSCVFCPQHPDAEWWDLRFRHPGDWERAVEAERSIHATHPEVFLHRSCVPLDQVVL